MSFLVWAGRTVLILGVLHFVALLILDAWTGAKRIKLPVMIAAAIPATLFMAWLGYVPFVLFFIWLYLNKQRLDVMTEPDFEAGIDVAANRRLFSFSSYSFIVLSCLLAYFFQTTVGTAPDDSNAIPLWRYLLGD